ncbi:MAG: hypothetical protein U0234_00535 [Sandaracinus sp.]
MKSVVDNIVASLRSVAELDAKLRPRGIRAADLLAAHGVPIVADAFYSAPALAEAMCVPMDTEDEEIADPVDVVRQVLGEAGIEIVSAEKRRGWHMELRARGEPRQVFNEDLEDLQNRDARLAPVQIGADLVRARLFHVKKRHSGAATFVTSGIESPSAPPLVFFALLEPQSVWVSSSGVLAWLAEDARIHPHDHRLDRVRLVPSEKPGGQIRCWFPLGDNSFAARYQIHDADGATVLPMTTPSEVPNAHKR